VKRFIAFCIGLLLVMSVWGFNTVWQSNGVPVFLGEELKWSGQSIADGNGNLILFWSDKSAGEHDVYAQAYDAQANPQWGQDPVLVLDTDGQTGYPYVTRLADETTGIVVLSSLGGQYQLRAQKIDDSGNQIWAGPGSSIPCPGFLPEIRSLIPDPTGGLYVIWDYQIDYEICGSHISSDGTVTWNTGDNLLLDLHDGNVEPPSYFSAEVNNEGGMLLAYGAQDTLSVISYDSDGIPGATTVLDSLSGCVANLWLTKLGTDRCLCVYKRRLNEEEVEIRGLLLNHHGIIIGEEPLSLYSGQDLDFRVAHDDNSAYVAVVQQQPVSSHRVFKIGYNGEHLWSPSGELCVIDYQCELDASFQIVPDDTGGLDLHLTEHPDYNLYHHIHHFTADASQPWGPSGATVFCYDHDIDPGSIVMNRIGDELACVLSAPSNDYDQIHWRTVHSDGSLGQAPEGVTILSRIRSDACDTRVVAARGVALILFRNDKTLRIQCVDGNGACMWNRQGVRIADNVDAYQTSVDEDGMLGIVYQRYDYVPGYASYVQFIDQEGNLLLPEDTVLGDSLQQAFDAKIESWGNSTFLIGWAEDSGAPMSAYRLQKYVNGQPAWTEPIELDPELFSLPFSVSEILDHWLIARENGQEYTLRVDDDGGLILSETVLTPSGTDDYYPVSRRHLEDGSLRFLFTTDYDRRYLQQISPDGALRWPIIGFELEDSDLASALMGQSDDYYFADQLGENWDYFVCRYDDSLQPMWQVMTLTGDGLYEGPGVLIGLGPHGRFGMMHLITTEAILGEAYALFAQFVSPEGHCYGGNEGVTVVGGATMVSGPSCAQFGYDSVITAWCDRRPYGDYTGRDLYAQLIRGDVTGVEDDAVSPIMLTANNFPNPFNPSTTITYSLSRGGEVSLSIYDMRGQRVKTLVAGKQEAGNHDVVWEGDDDHHRQLGSGVYLYRLESGSRSSVARKCLLLR
jgi:hypothetical protein